jgi:hypothetical protein
MAVVSPSIITTHPAQAAIEAGQLVKLVSGAVRPVNSQSDLPFGIALDDVPPGRIVGVVQCGSGYFCTSKFGDSVLFAQPGDPVYSYGDGWLIMAPTSGVYWNVGQCVTLQSESYFERGHRIQFTLRTPILESF